MTPKEKAEALVKMFHPHTYSAVHFHKGSGEYSDAIQCALKAVDEVIKSEPILPNNQKPFGMKIQSVRQNFIDAHDYWLQVKQEIQNL